MKKILLLLICPMLIISTVCGCMTIEAGPGSDDKTTINSISDTSLTDTTSIDDTPETPPVVDSPYESPLEYEIFKSGDDYYLKLIDYESYEYVDHPDGLCYYPVLSFNSFDEYFKKVNSKDKLSVDEANAMYLQFKKWKDQDDKVKITSIEEAIIPNITESFCDFKNSDMSIRHIVWSLCGYDLSLDLGEGYEGEFSYYNNKEYFISSRDSMWNAYFQNGSDKYIDKENGIEREYTAEQEDLSYTKMERFVIREGNKTIHVLERRAQTRSNILEKFDGKCM